MNTDAHLGWAHCGRCWIRTRDLCSQQSGVLTHERVGILTLTYCSPTLCITVPDSQNALAVFLQVYKFLYIRVVLFSIFCAFWHACNFARFFLKSQNNLGYGPNNTLGSPLKRHIQNLKISRSAQIYAYCTLKYNNKFKPTGQILLIFNFADPNRCLCKNRYLAMHLSIDFLIDFKTIYL